MRDFDLNFSAHVVQAEEAVVVDSYPAGLQLRLDQPDAGLTIGVSQRRYIYGDGAKGKLNAGWYFFRIPAPESGQVAVHARTLGLEVNVAEHEFGMTLGLQDLAFIAVGADESVRIMLDYTIEHPELTRAQICGREIPC